MTTRRDLRAVTIGRKRSALTPDQIRALPATVDIPTAARCFGIGATLAYELARTGQFPCPVLKLGRLYRVPRAGIESALGIDEPERGAI